MTLSLRFCLLYGCFKQCFIALKVELISEEKKKDNVRDGIMTLTSTSNQVSSDIWLYHFYDMTLCH